MPDSRLGVLKATLLLKEDHHRLRELFETYEGLGLEEIEQKEDLFSMIRAELVDHSAIEEDIFYPAVAQAEAPDALGLVEAAAEEHRIVSTLLDEMGELAPGETEFEAKMRVLKETVLRHARAEENEIFKLFKKLPRELQDEISEQMRERKRELGDGE